MVDVRRERNSIPLWHGYNGECFLCRSAVFRFRLGVSVFIITLTVLATLGTSASMSTAAIL